ncbi:hypothetical protein AB0873_31755 [Micromonospora sp. NPDC047707]|uniref:hypothetical protein n=1 Tax=Micromonospora sp. NPDC047707 TaxID=3154498 RepID=UPI0034517784
MTRSRWWRKLFVRLKPRPAVGQRNPWLAAGEGVAIALRITLYLVMLHSQITAASGASDTPTTCSKSSAPTSCGEMRTE